MAHISFPATLAWTSVKISMLRGTQSFTSPFTGKGQHISSPFQLWMISGDLIPYNKAKVAPIKSFLVQCGGKANTFDVPIVGTDETLTGYTGSAGTLKAVAIAGAVTASVEGLSLSTAVALEGEHITINGELKILTTNLTSDGSGDATANFYPPMRRPGAISDVVAFTDLTVKCRAVKDDIATWEITTPMEHAINVEFSEDV